ncbi:Lumazine-binding protein [Lactifluus volemus]|nr:Lumazine-binding protein [Lactifluus volemus]
MFTGLIEIMGTVTAIELDSGGCTLTISDAGPVLQDCTVGDSIAVNGACLTVTSFDAQQNGGWTDLGERKVGDQLNLERAMSAHVRFGGHFVQGHVDDTAVIVSKIPDGGSVRLVFRVNAATPTRPSLLPYLIPKGYVTIDGVSLTVTEVNDEERTFGIMLIQHTQDVSVTATLSGIGSAGKEWEGLIERVVEKVLARKGI